jgi:hypothetical protein
MAVGVPAQLGDRSGIEQRWADVPPRFGPIAESFAVGSAIQAEDCFEVGAAKSGHFVSWPVERRRSHVIWRIGGACFRPKRTPRCPSPPRSTLPLLRDSGSDALGSLTFSHGAKRASKHRSAGARVRGKPRAEQAGLAAVQALARVQFFS